MASFRNVARGICRVLYTGGVGQDGAMLTLCLDVPEAAADAASTLLCQHLLPRLVDAPAIAGVHLCRTDDATSRIDTAEKQARSDGTQIPRWIVLRNALAAIGAARFDQACYRLERQRCKVAAGNW